MASIEEMVNRYKMETMALLERCLKAEADRDLNDRVYHIECKEVAKANERIKELEAQLKECEERNTDLLARLDLMKEALEENGIALPYEEDKVEITTEPYVPDGGEEDAV